MPEILVKYISPFLKDITKKESEGIKLRGEGASVNDLVIVLTKKYGEKFRESLMKKDNVNPLIQVLVNGKNIRFLSGLDTKLKDRDVMAFVYHVGGGGR